MHKEVRNSVGVASRIFEWCEQVGVRPGLDLTDKWLVSGFIILIPGIAQVVMLVAWYSIIIRESKKLTILFP